METQTLDKTEKGAMLPVELIGGPLCGAKVPWQQGKKRAEIKYNPNRAELASNGTAVAVYDWEGDGKAVYVRG